MRVLLFRSLCDTGGVSSSMLLLGRQLRERGVAAEFWFCQASKRFKEFQALGGATVGPLPGLVARLANRDFNVVHMTATDPAALLVAQLAGAGAARVVVTARGALADIWSSRNCHAYTAISRGMAELNQPYTDLAIEVIRNSIDTSRYAPPAKARTTGAASRPIIAFVGRTPSPEKDFPRFTRIAARLAKRGARIWVADPHGADWAKFEGKSVERIEAERWEPIPHDAMPDFYRAVAESGGVVLITSISEGFGNVAPEAAACGARVVAPDVLGLREAVIDGVTGKLFATTASDEAVAAMLEDWMGQPHDAAAVAEATSREFSPAVMTDSYLAVYENPRQRLVSQKPLPPTDTPELRHLLAHLRRQAGWRAEFSRDAAIDLARAGFRSQAVRAFAEAVRAAPQQLARPSTVRQMMAFGWGLLRG